MLKHPALFLLLILFLTKLKGQDTIKYYRFTTAKYADVIIYNDSVTKKVFYNFLGRKTDEYTYLYDYLHAEAKGWYTNGKIKFKGNFFLNKKDGKWYYWYKNGKTEALEIYDKGKAVGTWFTWYKSGKLQSRRSFINDKLNGEYVIFYENGQPEIRAYYKNDTLNGMYTEYYMNGKKRYEIFYKNGNPQGVAKEWYSNGTMTLETINRLDSLKEVNTKKDSLILPFNKN